MSPEDPNNPGLNTKNPDFGSVPLPEPSPIKSPYAPVGGTLGEIANDVANNDSAPQTSPIPTPGIINNDQGAASDPINPATSVVPDGSTPQPAPVAGPSAPKQKSKKLPLIIGIIAALVIIGVVVFLVIAKPFGGDSGNDGKKVNGEAFYNDGNFIVSSEEKGGKRYAIYDQEGNAVTGFDYTDISDSFLAGTALARKGGKYGLIGQDGKEVIPFGEYEKIVAYGGLYGVEKDGQYMLLNNKGEKVINYEKEDFDHYLDIDSGKDTAYTVYGKDGHYTIYSPFGTKVTEFDSKIIPTVTSPDIGNIGSSSVIVYSDGVIVLDDSGNEVRRIKRSITAKMFGIFVSKTGNVVGLSTVNETLIKGLGSITAPEDKRENALIIGNDYYPYSYQTCSGLYYDDSLVEDDDDGYVLCIRGYSGYPIAPDGSVSQNTFSYNLAGSNPQSLYGGHDAIYPVGLNTYAIQPDNDSFGIFYKGKKVVNLVTDKKENTDKDKFTRTVSTISYRLLGMNDNYIVQRSSSDMIFKYKDKTLTGDASIVKKDKGEILFFDKKGEAICTLNKSGFSGITPQVSNYIKGKTYLADISNSNVVGFINNRALVQGLNSKGEPENGLRLINEKCETVDNDRYETIVKAGDHTVLVKKNNNGFTHSLIDKDNKTVTSFTETTKRPSDSVYSYMDDFNIFNTGKESYILGYGKVLHKISKYCVFGSGIRFTDNYTEFNTGGATSMCNEAGDQKPTHYYFNKAGKLFYQWTESTPTKEG